MIQIGKKLLVVEDDPGLQDQLRWCFDDYEVIVAGDRASAIDQMRRHQPPVVTLDLGLPPDPNGIGEGLATLEQIMSQNPDTKVIVITGQDDRVNAVRAVGSGAYYFYHKPVDPVILSMIVNRAYRLRELEMENRALLQQKVDVPVDGIIACSPEMVNVCRAVERVAPSDASILLLGDSGTGKELCARSLHSLSPRSSKKFNQLKSALGINSTA